MTIEVLKRVTAETWTIDRTCIGCESELRVGVGAMRRHDNDIVWTCPVCGQFNIVRWLDIPCSFLDGIE